MLDDRKNYRRARRWSRRSADVLHLSTPTPTTEHAVTGEDASAASASFHGVRVAQPTSRIRWRVLSDGKPTALAWAAPDYETARYYTTGAVQTGVVTGVVTVHPEFDGVVYPITRFLSDETTATPGHTVARLSPPPSDERPAAQSVPPE